MALTPPTTPTKRNIGTQTHPMNKAISSSLNLSSPKSEASQEEGRLTEDVYTPVKRNSSNKQNFVPTFNLPSSSISQDNAIYFYKTNDPYFCFSNFSRHGLTIDRIEYPTAENYYQSQKFIDTNIEYAQYLTTASPPMKAYRQAKQWDESASPDWKKKRDEVMHTAVLEKFRQNSDIRAILLSTGNRQLIENSPFDSYWGIGPNKDGKNQLGKILMVVREQLRQEFPEEIETLASHEYLTPSPRKEEGYILLPYPKVLEPVIRDLKKARNGKEVYQILTAATRKIEGFQDCGENEYYYNGFTFFYGSPHQHSNHLDVLELASKHQMKLASKLVEYIKVDPFHSVLITQIPDLEPGQHLKSYIGNESSVTNEARDTFKKEVQKLMKSGYIHPFSNRSNAYIRLHPKTGHLMMDSLAYMTHTPQAARRLEFSLAKSGSVSGEG